MKNIIDIKNSIIGVNISNINIIISNNTIKKTIYTNKNTTDIKNKRIINNNNKNIFSLTQSGLGEWARDGKRAKSGRREKERSARRRSRRKLKGWEDFHLYIGNDEGFLLERQPSSSSSSSSKKGAPGGDRKKSSKGEQNGNMNNFLKDFWFVFCI